jgi:PAS domain S-box-containing protein
LLPVYHAIIKPGVGFFNGLGVRRSSEESGMQDEDKSREQLTTELQELRQRLAELENEKAEHKRAEEALRQNQDMYRRVAESMPGMVFTFVLHEDGSFSLPYVNGRIMEYAGISSESVMAEPALLFTPIHHDDLEMVQQTISASARTLQDFTLEHRLIDVNGQLRWFRVESKPQRLSNGDILWNGVSIDITERKRAEEALREGEERFRAVVEGSEAGYFFIAQDGAYQNVNSAWLRMHGLTTRDEVIGKHFALTQVEAALPEAGEIVDRVLSGESVPTGEFSRRCNDGSVGYHTFTISPVVRLGEIVGLEGFLIDITQRKLMEESLRESERRFHSIFDSMGEIVVLHELVSDATGRPVDYRIIECNPAFSTVTGIPRDSAVGALASKFYGTGEPPYLAVYGHVAQTGERAQFEAYFEPMQKYFQISVVSPSKGHFATISWDITEHVHQQQEINLLNRLYSVLSQVSQAVVRATSPESFLEESCRVIVEEGGFLLGWIGYVEASNSRVVPSAIWGAASDYARNITVYADDRPEGRGPTGTCIRERRPIVYNDFLNDPLAQPWRERAARFGIHGAAAFPIESEGRVWGALTIYSDKVGFFGDKDVKLLEKVAGNIGFALDNLERDGQRLSAEQALRESEAQLRQIIDLVPHMIFVKDWDGKYLLANRAVAEGYNTSVSALTGKSHVDFHPDENELHRMLQDDREVIAKGEIKIIPEEAYTDVQGKVRFLQTIKVPFHTFGNKTRAVLGVAVDITESNRAEEEKQKLQAQLLQAQKMEAVGRLAGGVAHDFNNMLGIIIGHAEMALDEVDSSQAIFADLQEIRKAAERSASLTRQLLAFARKQTVAPKVLDLNETVEGMLKMLRRLIGEDVDLAWLPGKNLWAVKVDPAQIDQILANLCINARDAITGVGKITIETVTTTLDEAYCADHPGFAPGEFVLLAVSDNGCGMDKDTLGKVFEPFFTTKGIGQGTGLGLATVYGIVKQNNGFINVYSEPGRGTTFKIYIPRHAGQAGEDLKVSAVEIPKGRGETVLLVEDEPTILNMTAKMLERQGYTVLTASKPSEAMLLADEHTGKIHLLITDVVMPEMNGRDLAQNLLSLYPNIKSLFMSGYTANVIAHHGVLDEGVHFIQKPFSKQDLGAKVREVLGE